MRTRRTAVRIQRHICLVPKPPLSWRAHSPPTIESARIELTTTIKALYAVHSTNRCDVSAWSCSPLSWDCRDRVLAMLASALDSHRCATRLIAAVSRVAEHLDGPDVREQIRFTHARCSAPGGHSPRMTLRPPAGPPAIGLSPEFMRLPRERVGQQVVRALPGATRGSSSDVAARWRALGRPCQRAVPFCHRARAQRTRTTTAL